MDLFSQESEASTSRHSGWDGKTNFIANGMNSDKKSYTTTGRKRNNTQTSKNLLFSNGEEESTSSRVVSLVNRTAAQENEVVYEIFKAIEKYENKFG